LFIALATVKIHVYNIFRKMGVNSRMQLLLRIQQEANKLQ
jgi:DNA-binding NarL/FixJ family response regulator